MPPTPSPLPADLDINKPFVMPATARSAVGEVTTDPSVQASPKPDAVPHTQSTAGAAPTAPQDTAEPAPAPTEPENKAEGTADSLFNLFNDTVGEESEISKFASNFDNVSLDSLLGDGQGLLDSLHKK